MIIKEILEKYINLISTIFEKSSLENLDILFSRLDSHFESGGRIFLAGNGGSAADAQHIAAEFIGKLNLKRKALPAIALNTDTSILTSISNDYHFSEIFSRQIEGIGKINDIFLGITTSGKSKNILKAIKSAKDKQIKVIKLVSNPKNKNFLSIN